MAKADSTGFAEYKEQQNTKKRKIGFWGWFGIIFLIAIIANAINPQKPEPAKSTAPTITARELDCLKNNSKDYCTCVHRYVRKHTGYLTYSAWSGGNAMKDAEGRQAIIQAGFSCNGL
jgi:hypothetical protein